MNDEPQLRARLFEYLDNVQPGTQTKDVVQGVADLYNEHSTSTKILDWNDKNHLKRLQKLLKWLQKRLENRDEELEAQRKETLGDRYDDYLTSQIAALEWVIQFIKEHSV